MCASFFQLAIGSWNMYVEQAWQHADFNLETSHKFFFVLKKKQEVLIVPYDETTMLTAHASLFHSTACTRPYSLVVYLFLACTYACGHCSVFATSQ